jgi:hypothetical protein
MRQVLFSNNFLRDYPDRHSMRVAGFLIGKGHAERLADLPVH